MSSDKRNLKIHQPGEAPSPQSDDVAAIDIADDLLAEKPLTDDDLIEQEVQRRLAKAQGRKEGEHPHQSDIDATKISRAQMSTDGWVCPAPPPLDAATEALRKVMAR